MAETNVRLNGARFLISLFIFYEVYLKEAFGNIPLLLYGTVILATILVIVDIIYNKGKLPIMVFPFALLVFGVYSYLTGILVSRDMSWFNSSMVTFFAFSVVCFDCCYVIKKGRSSEWLLNIYLITAFVCSIHTIFWGADYKTEVIVRTMSVENNPNILGLTMIIGIFALISRKKYVIKRFWLIIVICLIFLYVILLTASRKCLFSALALIVLWLFSVLRTDRGFSLRKISMIFTIVLVVGFGSYFFINKYASTSSYARMLLLNRGLSTRTTMYLDAIDYWKTSPIIGIGFGQYQVWSPYKAFSHSSYAEILCCTGVLGFILFFVPLFYCFSKIAKAAVREKRENRYDYAMCLTMALVELGLGLGQIFLYDVSHLLIITYLSISVESISLECIRDQELQKVYGYTYIHRRFFKSQHQMLWNSIEER